MAWMTLEEAAKQQSRSIASLCRSISGGELPAYRAEDGATRVWIDRAAASVAETLAELRTALDDIRGELGHLRRAIALEEFVDDVTEVREPVPVPQGKPWARGMGRPPVLRIAERLEAADRSATRRLPPPLPARTARAA